VSRGAEIPTRLWLDRHAELIERLRAEGATLARISEELAKLGRRVQLSQISGWLKRREAEARRRTWEDRVIAALRENNERLAAVAKSGAEGGLAAVIMALEKLALQLSVTLSADQTGLDPSDLSELKEQLSMLTTALKPLMEYRRVRVAEQQSELDRRRLEEQTVEKFLAWYEREAARRVADSSLPSEEKIRLLRREFFADVDAAEKKWGAMIPGATDAK
jgi:hypothetical protein